MKALFIIVLGVTLSGAANAQWRAIPIPPPPPKDTTQYCSSFGNVAACQKENRYRREQRLAEQRHRENLIIQRRRNAILREK